MKRSHIVWWIPLAGLVVCLAGASRAQGAWVNGWWVYPYKYFSNKTVGRRPMADSETGLSLSDWRISRLPLMEKGMNITGTKLADGSFRCYRWIAVWHTEVSDVWRTPGGHVDFIRICGGGKSQRIPTTVLLQDIQLHDGDGLPLLIQDGWYDKITLKGVRIWNTNIGAQVAMYNGFTDSIVIEDCPGLQFLLLGPPGSIRTVYVKNSPGIRIQDNPGKTVKTGAKIIYAE